MTTSMTWAEVLKWIILGILVVLQVGQAYTIVNLRRRLPGTNRRLQVGMTAPGLRTQEARSHDRVVLEDFIRDGRPAVLVFVSPSCASCKRLVPLLNTLAEEHDSVDFFCVIAAGRGYDFKANLTATIHAVPDADGSWQRDFEVSVFPHVTAIDRDGRIAAQGVQDARGMAEVIGSLASNSVGGRSPGSDANGRTRS